MGRPIRHSQTWQRLCPKLRRGNSAKRGKVRKAAQAKTVAKAKPKRAPVKKVVRKQPVAPVVETVAVEVIEQPAPGVISVTEVEEHAS